MLGKYGDALTSQIDKNERLEALSKHLEKNKVAGEKTMTMEQLADMEPEELARSLSKKKTLGAKKRSSKINLDDESQGGKEKILKVEQPKRGKVDPDPRMNHPHVKGGGTLFM